MARFRTIAALAIGYMVFAVLLNSVGTVILQAVATMGVDKPHASLLEACKDLTIALTSFLFAAFVPRLGYRRSTSAALAAVGVACLLVPLRPRFGSTELLFVCIGAGFAFTKVSVYSSIGLLARDKGEHSRLTNLIEGLFMVGVLGGGWLFSLFVDPAHPADPGWVRVYWWLAAGAVLSAALLATSPLDESAVAASAGGGRPGLRQSVGLMASLLVVVFLASAFLYVLIEQGFGTWLPTFNREVLHLSNAMSIQLATALAGCTALGRLGAGLVLKRIHWYPLLAGCVVLMAVLVMVTLPMAARVGNVDVLRWADVPPVAYAIPMLGLLLAPIYPVINSVALSALPLHVHAPMTGLIVVFSALGGTLGSRITSIVFAHSDGVHAFYFSLIPMALLLGTLTALHRQSRRAQPAVPSPS
jgi:fucose permease